MNDCDMQANIVKNHLQVIVDRCLKLQSDLVAIILCGGFGRDEGSWFKGEDGTWKPYNDYDLSIVTRDMIPAVALKTLANDLSREIGIKWIDLNQIHPDEMKRLQPSILNYDFREASKVIYGDATVLDNIPMIDRTTLPMQEVHTLFFTRLYTLLGSLGEKGCDKVLDGEMSRFFRNQMAKAILAVVDVLLLAKGEYDASYCDRVKKVAKLYPEKNEFIELSQWALAEKLRPQAPLMNPDDVRCLYGRVHRCYFIEMYRGLSIYFGKSVNGPADVEHCMKWNPILMLNRMWSIMRFCNFRQERRISVLMAQSYIAAAWRPTGMNKNELLRGIELLRRADGRVPKQLTWDAARLEAVRLRMEM